MQGNLWLGFGLGAAVAFIADPLSGRRRRALARDQMVKAVRKTREGLDATAQDVSNRATGVLARTRRRFSDASADEATLTGRVRSTLGRVCSHPAAIDVYVSGRDVTLSGPVLAAEASDIVSAVSAVPGVETVMNILEVHESTEGVPSLQGEGRIATASAEMLAPRRWSPATRALVAVAGMAATGLMVAQARR
jgi:hypothetical protein